MKKNMGTLDIVIRLVIAAIVIVLYFMQILSGTLAIILLVISGVFILTSIFNICPLYLVFGLSTRSKK